MTNVKNELLQCPECGSMEVKEDESGKFCGRCKAPVSDDNTVRYSIKNSSWRKNGEMAKVTAKHKPTKDEEKKASIAAKDGESKTKAKVEKAAKNGKVARRKKTSKVVGKSVTKTRNPLKGKPVGNKANLDNPYRSKLDDDSGRAIDDMYVEGTSWRDIASQLGVTVNAVRFRLLTYLLDKVHGKARRDAK